jgi:hypothetical protein
MTGPFFIAIMYNPYNDRYSRITHNALPHLSEWHGGTDQNLNLPLDDKNVFFGGDVLSKKILGNFHDG